MKLDSHSFAAATAKVSEEKARRAVHNEGEQKCVVCLEAARDVVFMPCFHVVSGPVWKPTAGALRHRADWLRAGPAGTAASA